MWLDRDLEPDHLRFHGQRGIGNTVLGTDGSLFQVTAPRFLGVLHLLGTIASGFARTIKSLVKYVLVARGSGPAMIGFMSIDVQAEVDFDRARRRALFGRLAAHMRRECSRLGLRDVKVSKIVGSVGRHEAFDRGFMPTRASLEERWKRVDRAFHHGLDLPAVRLYKIGDSYFVEDGNHRVSVARYQGVETIEADVTEFYPLYRAHPGLAA
jgi:hypothetical protein